MLPEEPSPKVMPSEEYNPIVELLNTQSLASAKKSL
jgi:hypothetical protein